MKSRPTPPTKISNPLGRTERSGKNPVAAVPNRVAAWISLAILAVLLLIDLVDSPTLEYVGIYTSLPLLAAVFTSPRLVAVVGSTTLVTAYLHGVFRDVDDTTVQWVRIFAIFIASVVAVFSSHLRERREERLRVVTDVAQAAQLALLHPVPAKIGKLECAVQYFSAVEQSMIGGDLYEVTQTPWGVRVLLGDVRGKGLDAVKTGSEVLGAFRHLAHTEPDLQKVVAGLDGAADRAGGDEDFVTAVVAQVENGEVIILNCGHPSPMFVCPEGVKELTATEFSLPLGLGADPTPQNVLLPKNSTLFLYTDGLAEARDENGEFFSVVDNLQIFDDGPVAGLELLTRNLFQHVNNNLSDDVALLAITNQG